MNANFATKPDLKELEYSLSNSMKDMGIRFEKKCDETELNFNKRCDGIERNIEKLETTLVTKLGGLMIVLFGVATTIIKI